LTAARVHAEKKTNKFWTRGKMEKKGSERRWGEKTKENLQGGESLSANKKQKIERLEGPGWEQEKEKKKEPVSREQKRSNHGGARELYLTTPLTQERSLGNREGKKKHGGWKKKSSDSNQEKKKKLRGLRQPEFLNGASKEKKRLT